MMHVCAYLYVHVHDCAIYTMWHVLFCTLEVKMQLLLGIVILVLCLISMCTTADKFPSCQDFITKTAVHTYHICWIAWNPHIGN